MYREFPKSEARQRIGDLITNDNAELVSHKAQSSLTFAGPVAEVVTVLAADKLTKYR
ncbi:MAG: hypothetical protein P8P24_01225 [Planktomarina sp.]|nr:hypothetical protein [Planktomarina sp.]